MIKNKLKHKQSRIKKIKINRNQKNKNDITQIIL